MYFGFILVSSTVQYVWKFVFERMAINNMFADMPHVCIEKSVGQIFAKHWNEMLHALPIGTQLVISIYNFFIQFSECYFIEYTYF